MHTAMRTMVVAMMLGGALGCGGGGKNTTATTPTTGATAATSSTATSEAAEDEGIAEKSKAAAAEAKANGPVAAPAPDKEGLIELKTLQSKPAADAAKDFPPKKQDDKACVGDVNLSGKSTKDYDEVGSKCGTATGMKPYVQAVTGSFGPGHDRDVYTFTMVGGLCYRFFAVGDDSLENMNIRVESMTGALLSMDSTKQPIAILDPDAPWCKTHDRAFRFVVESTKGQGSYVFGVWARPK